MTKINASTDAKSSDYRREIVDTTKNLCTINDWRLNQLINGAHCESILY